MSLRSKKILVVGAGLGGLAAAIRLARAGHAVEMWERNEGPGGKLKELRLDGFRWGMGPSLLTMPHVLWELFTDAGERLEDHLDLVRLESCCRYFWTDGTIIDEDAAFWARPEVARFLEYARGIYELSGEAYLNRPPADFWRAFTPRNWPKLRHLGKVATFRTMADEVTRRISDPHLRQIFLRFATYNGSSPYLTPATFNIIPYVEAEFGAWYVRGGMSRIAEELAALAARTGVAFRYNTTATDWDGQAATASNGSRTRADFLICNGDVLGAAGSRRLPGDGAPQGFLSKIFTDNDRKSLHRPPLSTSGFILFQGVRDRDPRLSHHNIFFSDDYRNEFDEIHHAQISPSEPTIYISVSARTDPDHAPEGHDNYFVLINAPARDPQQPWTEAEAKGYRDLVGKRLERFGLADLSQRIVTEQIFTPSDFATRDLAHHGALYGWASHSIGTSLFRPPLRAPGARNVFFTGGTTHPGGGIPLVLLSGKMVAELIQREAQMKNWNRAEKGFLAAFVIWTVAGLIFTVLRISPDSIAHWPIPEWLRNFVGLCLSTGDPILILLAFANTHLHAARQWTSAVARRWGAIVLGASLLVETLGAMTGFPFGIYTYTDRFGPLLGVVPLTIPLAWHVVVTNALFIVRGLRPYASRAAEAAWAGLVCTIYDFILEPFATTIKHYWNWSGGTIPLQNYGAWFVLSGLLVWFFAPTAATRFSGDPRPRLILSLTILIFIAGRWAG